jgi:hypothetical protein
MLSKPIARLTQDRAKLLYVFFNYARIFINENRQNATPAPAPAPAVASKPTPTLAVVQDGTAPAATNKVQPSAPAKQKAVPAPKPSATPAAYTHSRALSLFKTYADPDDPNVIGPEGFQQLCTDADISMEGALPLILAWQLDAKEMAKFAKDEWFRGMEALQ